MAIIGGNLADIEQTAGRIDDSGQKAIDTFGTTHSAADQLATVIEESMTNLVNRFADIAAELKADIAVSDERLNSAEWQGASRDAAVSIKQDLTSQVNGVLGTATQNLELEKMAFINRSAELVAHIDVEFKNVMTQVNEQYAALAAAARKTAENLETADQTIRMG